MTKANIIPPAGKRKTTYQWETLTVDNPVTIKNGKGNRNSIVTAAKAYFKSRGIEVTIQSRLVENTNDLTVYRTA